MKPGWLDRRVMWLLLALSYVYVSLYRLSTAVLSEDLASDFAATATEMGSLHAVFFAVYAPLQFAAGVLADRYGPRRVVAAGALVMHAGALAFSTANSLELALAGRFLMGAGASVIFISTLRFCANWYGPREFATVSGVTVAVSGVGGVLATYPLAVAVEAIGWRGSLAGLGVTGLFTVALVAGLVRDRPSDPAEYGVPEFEATADAGDAWRGLKRVATSRQTWLIGGVFAVGTGVNTTVYGLWGVPYLVQVYGLELTDAAGLTLLGSLGLAVGPPVVGRLSDLLEARLPLMAVASTGFTACYGSIAVLGDPPLVVVGTAFFAGGFLVGGFALGLTVMKESYPMGLSGTAMSVVNAAGFVAAAALPTALGVVLDSYWTGDTVGGARVYSLAGYRLGFALLTAFCILAVVLNVVLLRRGVEREVA